MKHATAFFLSLLGVTLLVSAYAAGPIEGFVNGLIFAGLWLAAEQAAKRAK